MATVQISDIYNPLTFARRAQEAQTQANAFISSGIMTDDPALTAQASTGGNIGELSNYAPLAVGEPNYSNDATGTSSTPANISSQEMKYRLASMNKSWSVMDISRDLALEDPVAAITGRIGSYWANHIQNRIIQSCMGILADNDANDSDDMIVNVATDAVGTPAAGELISGDLLIDAEQTMGDKQTSITAVAMHSVLYSKLRKAGFIEYIKDDVNNTRFASYDGKRVIVDDGLPAVAGTNRITYTSILFGSGTFVNGKGNVAKPSELERDASSGNGGGQDIIHSRLSEIIHPLGFSFESASVAGQSATLAELATATNWNRVWERKNIPMAFLKTNG